MKPAEIFEKHPHMDAYRVGGFYSPYCTVSTEKRFTDAELAAEYHAGMREFELIGLPGRRSPRLGLIADALHRFATLPHLERDA